MMGQQKRTDVRTACTRKETEAECRSSKAGSPGEGTQTSFTTPDVPVVIKNDCFWVISKVSFPRGRRRSLKEN